MKTIRGCILVLLAAACGKATNDLPPFVQGDIKKATYDGQSDDLLTAGVGKSGLVITAAAPGFVNPASPTAAELRRRAIVVNYRALVDASVAGGFGTLYGPNIDVNGNDTLGEGKIAGDEWIAYDDDGSGRQNVTMMVQLPASFDKTKPCIVTATSSGSRGVYGAIATAGEWGLKHGCAVAYTDKGSGNDVHDLQNNTVTLIDGTRADAAQAGASAAFNANLSDADRAAFNVATPNRLAIKHAHSQQNPEKDWGTNTLHAIRFAFYMINEKYGQQDGQKHLRTFDQHNTLTIAASVSNGGGAALAAAEQDTDGLIWGVVAGEPQVQVRSTSSIQRGTTTQISTAKSLYDYMTLAALYQPCAAQSTAAVSDLFNLTVTAQGANRCASLKAKGLLTAATAAGQADEALQRLHDAGWQAESDILHNSHFGLYATTAVAVMYANAYARASVKDNLCGYSYAFVDSTTKQPVPVTAGTNAASLAAFFGTGNGVPPSSGIELIANNAQGGATRDQDSVTVSTGVKDYNVDGALCLRDLLANNATLQASLTALQHTGNLHRRPAILVQGRADALVPVNHASRAYYGANQLAEGTGSQAVYYEVTNAQHFDAFLTLPNFSKHFVPLHRYVVQSLDLMYAHLTTGAPLPRSQVVRTQARGTANISLTNVPAISASPSASDQITFSGTTLTIPE